MSTSTKNGSGQGTEFNGYHLRVGQVRITSMGGYRVEVAVSSVAVIASWTCSDYKLLGTIMGGVSNEPFTVQVYHTRDLLGLFYVTNCTNVNGVGGFQYTSVVLFGLSSAASQMTVKRVRCITRVNTTPYVSTLRIVTSYRSVFMIHDRRVGRT